MSILWWIGLGIVAFVGTIFVMGLLFASTAWGSGSVIPGAIFLTVGLATIGVSIIRARR